MNEVSGRDGQGYPFQRCSKVALSSRQPQQIVVTCPAQIDVRRGATAELSCSVTSEIPYTVKWFKDKQQITGYPDENKVYNLNENIEVKWYRGLDPRYELKNGRRHTINLNQDTPPGGLTSAFTTRPVVNTDEEIVTFKEGSSLVLSCRSEGVPKPKIIWAYNDVPVTISTDDDQRITESRLIIRPAKSIDAGNYSCIAINSAGNSTINIVANFISPPKIDKLEMSSSLPVEGQEQIFTCYTTGKPKPKVKWDFNGSPFMSC
ncbi:Hemicentin-1 [Schistosoma japonicum]|nr:Hemicentin-1 [Schistosoma japonicum]